MLVAMTISSGNEFHVIMTLWIKKYFLVSILNLMLFNFMEGPQILAL